MGISSFDDLVRAAREQSEPQRLKTGLFGSFIPFDRQGQPMLFN